ncbi:probable phospholipid-transporting ATPase VD [Leptonychotes weddellii]|uniref:Phospholipid-transporting ATPase n=1 Tax=Leptonychotes weddellii TaxID=9713 RepID=A0A2U3Y9D1_LEPWE|nr:probable phospholipid-transporting ATPase VD [Leptonychotes weddellii]
MTECLQWARYHWQQLMGGRNRDEDERSYSYSSLLVCGGKSSQPPRLAGKHRVVVPHLWPFKDEYEKYSGTYVNNRIRTTKYTLLNFVPRNLFEQFHRAANLYFLFLAVLNWVPLVEAFQKEITMLPLVVVLTIIAIKDGLEDYRKYKIDKQINNLVTQVYSRKEKRYVDQCWKDVAVGDFIRLSCNEVIPADMVLLFSTDPDGICHIETSGLDGESNLKQRQVVRGYAEQDSEVDPEKFSSKIECESPNNDLNRFRGYLWFDVLCGKSDKIYKNLIGEFDSVVMSDTEYAEWLRNHFLAETSIDHREELLLESAMRLENKLTLLGATGIEDRLQEGVPESIEALQKAGIKIWMLTGDKQETAINVAYACKLLEPGDKLFILNTQSKDACETLMSTILKELQEKNPTSPELASLREGLQHTQDCGLRAGLIITGKALQCALQEGLQRQFLELTACCQAVVCCRATPLQKSEVVKLVRSHLQVMTLAIGDGANDVSMIQVADIGIGISGQEGMQAVMASDFAIAQFKHLGRLLLVHGHWCYARLSNMILYFFYKNVAYVNLLFWYQFFCGFSGTSMTDYWVLILFNLLFTSAPPVIYGVLEKDVSAETLMQLPELYKGGQKSEAYLPLTFWITLLDAFYQSLVCFFVPYYTYQDSDIDIFAFGNPLNTAALFIIILHLVIESKSLVSGFPALEVA